MTGATPRLAGTAPLPRRRATLVLLGALLAGCGTPPRVAPPPGDAVTNVAPAPPADPRHLQVVFSAMQQVGVPYRYGGATPTGFDCSGLVQYVFANAGLSLPRTAADQRATATPVPLEAATAGDLLFFRDGGTTSHVAIYVGQGRFIHAPRSGRTVSLDTFADTYWRSHFAGAGRVLPVP